MAILVDPPRTQALGDQLGNDPLDFVSRMPDIPRFLSLTGKISVDSIAPPPARVNVLHSRPCSKSYLPNKLVKLPTNYRQILDLLEGMVSTVNVLTGYERVSTVNVLTGYERVRVWSLSYIHLLI